MYPIGINAIVDVSAVRAHLGTPVRIYPYDDVPPNPVLPYASHNLVAGTPENCLDGAPTHDDERIQFDVWADSSASLTGAVVALRTQLQGSGNINLCISLGRDPETRRYGMAIDWSRLDPWPPP